MLKSLWTRSWWIQVCVLAAGCLAGCEKTETEVNLHGVNYGGDAFSYYITDPARPKIQGVGEGIIDPFAGGGTTCCFTLPKKWRPGIKVQIRTTHWLPEKPDGSLPEVKQVHLVDVPPYVDGVPGELWVLRGADRSVNVISSDFQPDHPKWPGKLKGWPVPSLAYQRERWELIKNHQEMFVRSSRRMLDGIKESPRARAREAWEHASKFKEDRANLKHFSGPDDPRYKTYLMKRYEQDLNESREGLERVMGMRP